MDATNPQQNEAEVVDRMTQFLGGEDEEEVIDEEVEVEEAEASDVEEQDVPADEEIELTWNGEQVKKPKAEVLELAQKGFDYTQKTQALAEERRVMQEQIAAVQQQMQVQNALMDQIGQVKQIEAQLAQFNQVNWQQLIDSDPVEAMKLDRQYRELQNYYGQAQQQVQASYQNLTQAQAQQQQAMLQREYQAMMTAIPEWRDEGKATAEKSELKSYLAKSGYSEGEIDQAYDHRAISIARKAMLYDKLMSQKPEVNKRVAEAPKPIKPGTKQRNPRTEAFNQRRAELKRTGRTDVAAKLIESLL